jgi:hypothetical protein
MTYQVDRRGRLIGLGLVLATIAVFLAACSSDPTPTPTSRPAPTATSTATAIPPTATPTPTLRPGATPRPTANPTPVPTSTPTPSGAASSRLPLVAPYKPFSSEVIETLYQAALEEAASGGELLTYLFSPSEQHKVFMERFPGLTENVVTVGLTRPSRIIQESDAGQRTADWMSGSIAQIFPLSDRDLAQEFDWAGLGVPAELLEPEMNSWVQGVTSWSINYNAQVIDPSDIPTDLRDFLDPKWRGKLAGTPFFVPPAMGSWGMRFGQGEAVALTRQLIDSGNLLITNNPNPLVFSGERPVMLFQTPTNALINSQLQGGPLDFKLYDGTGLFFTHAIVLENSQVPNTAALKAIWSATVEANQLDKQAGAGWSLSAGPLADPVDPILIAYAKNLDLLERETLENWTQRNDITNAVRGAILGGG